MMLYLDTGRFDPVFFLRILLRAHAPRKSAPCGDLLRQWDHPSRYPMLMTVIFHRHCCCRGMKCEQMVILFYTHRSPFPRYYKFKVLPYNERLRSGLMPLISLHGLFFFLNLLLKARQSQNHAMSCPSSSR